eukprot:356265-Chlamydomonas_euryale.AAC.2
MKTATPQTAETPVDGCALEALNQPTPSSFSPYLLHGAPHGLRARVWEAALCLPPLPPHQSKLDSANADGSPAALLGELCGRVVAQPTLPDVAALADVAAAAESEHFFLFEVSLAWVKAHLSAVSQSFHGTVQDRHGQRGFSVFAWYSSRPSWAGGKAARLRGALEG